MFDLDGKRAIITGSTKGIGKAIAQCFARAGAKVVISSRKADMCEKVAEEIKAEGHEALAIPCHVGRREDLEALVAGTVDAWGGVDILVCNAATNPVYGPMADAGDEVFNKIMETNVLSVYQLCNMVCPMMAGDGAGSVIVISSIAGLRGNSVIGIYGVSKAAEAGLVRNLAVEWGPKGIRANAISPGLIKTDFARALWEDPVRLERAKNQTPLRRIGVPEDIAGVALFLASDASAYVTGQNLVADGGETIS
ncbi:MAG: SDR family oxidoreductase [Rhizobiales bacterium]|nr:SDR family oxidoreductase [Hyphomicrobiales bacterium]